MSLLWLLFSEVPVYIFDTSNGLGASSVVKRKIHPQFKKSRNSLILYN